MAESERGTAQALYEQGRWADALAELREAARSSTLSPEELDRMVWSAALVGDDEQFLRGLEQLHDCCAIGSSPRMAARAAFWLGFHLLSLNEAGRAMGWLARAQRHLDGVGDDCAERGYLLLPSVLERLEASDLDGAAIAAHRAAAIGERCADRDLVALARNLEGRALLRQGRVDDGLVLLDEVMVATTAGELSPIVTGIVYCNVIATCQQMQVLDRAREWTDRLADWCEKQPQLVTFTGQCLVHRAEVLQLRGAWQQAIDEVRQVCDQICRGDPEVLGDAWYQHAEILRLRGRLDDAERSYREAADSGRDPQPGLALLRVAQGRVDAAVAAIQRLLDETEAAWRRARLLPAYTEIMLAAGDLERARAGARELATIAEAFPTDVLSAMAAHARGAVALAEGDAAAAVEPLRQAFGVWNRMGAPYLAARIRVLIARSNLARGDADGAQLEIDSARRVFEELGAEVDLRRLGDLAGSKVPAQTFGLSPRELEVLRHVAAGKTNKLIAGELHISERTVDRHVSNILDKLDARSRAAATAFAFKNGLV